MEQRKEHNILSDEFKTTLKKIAYNIRNDTEFLLFITGAITLILTILVILWVVPGGYGISAYAKYISTTYPGFPVEQDVVVMFYNILIVVTKMVVVLVWFLVVLYMVAFALSEDAIKKKQVTGIRNHGSRKRIRSRVRAQVDTCAHCGSVHTRPAGKEHATGERYCMTCRKFY